MKTGNKCMPITIEFGAFAPRLSVQLDNKGFTAPSLNHFQDQLDNIVTLLVCGYLTPNAAKSTQVKIIKALFKVMVKKESNL